MPRPMCQLNLTLDVPTAQHVENIGFAAHYPPSGAGRILLRERLDLETAGWNIDDEELATILEAVCRVKKDARQEIIEAISRAAAA